MTDFLQVVYFHFDVICANIYIYTVDKAALKITKKNLKVTHFV